MGRIKVICCGYRDWSLQIFDEIKKLHDINLTIFTKPDLVVEEKINTITPDVIFFYGWSWIVPNEIINKYLCLCLHPSPLPKYRGGSPIQHQILAGEKISAVSIFKMNKELDAGPICFQEEFSLEGNIHDIFDRISIIGKKATRIILNKIQTETLIFVPQPEGSWPIYKRRKPSESEITMEEISNLSAKKLHDKIRMLTDPYPNAFITCGDGTKLFITGSHL